MHRREAEVLAALPASVPAPRLVDSIESGTWVVLVTELVEGSSPSAPIGDDELSAMLAVVTELAAIDADDGITRALGRVCDGDLDGVTEPTWQRIVDDGRVDRLDGWARAHVDRLVALERHAAAATVGSTLLHRDLRIDNVVVGRGGTTIVDWPSAGVGAPWIDLVGLLPSLHLDGGPPPHEVFDRHPVGRAADAEAVDAYLTAVAGYFVEGSLRPPPPGLPTLRAFQRRQGVVACDWLATRLRW